MSTDLSAFLQTRCIRVVEIAAVVVAITCEREGTCVAAEDAAVVVGTGVCLWAGDVDRPRGWVTARDDCDPYGIGAGRIVRLRVCVSRAFVCLLVLSTRGCVLQVAIQIGVAEADTLRFPSTSLHARL